MTTPLPPTDAPESGRSLFGQLLKFVGLLLSVGGSLALIRLLGTPEERDWFYLALMPIGLATWFVGAYLAKDKPGDGTRAGPQERDRVVR